MGRVKKRGSSLVEIILAVVFIAICVAPILNMVRTSQVRSNDSKARMVALALAQDELAKLRSQARTGSPPLGTRTWTVDSVPGLWYPAQFKLTASASPDLPKLTRIALEVVYDEAGGKIALSTHVKSP